MKRERVEGRRISFLLESSFSLFPYILSSSLMFCLSACLSLSSATLLSSAPVVGGENRFLFFSQPFSCVAFVFSCLCSFSLSLFLCLDMSDNHFFTSFLLLLRLSFSLASAMLRFIRGSGAAAAALHLFSLTLFFGLSFSVCVSAIAMQCCTRCTLWCITLQMHQRHHERK